MKLILNMLTVLTVGVGFIGCFIVITAEGNFLSSILSTKYPRLFYYLLPFLAQISVLLIFFLSWLTRWRNTHLPNVIRMSVHLFILGMVFVSLIATYALVLSRISGIPFSQLSDIFNLDNAWLDNEILLFFEGLLLYFGATWNRFNILLILTTILTLIIVGMAYLPFAVVILSNWSSIKYSVRDIVNKESSQRHEAILRNRLYLDEVGNYENILFAQRVQAKQKSYRDCSDAEKAELDRRKKSMNDELNSSEEK